jgi:glutathione reductase (NADPH)
VIRGCIPKKLMGYGAHFAEHFESAKGYGWRPGEPSLDWGALIEARDREIDRLNGIYINMLKSAGVELIRRRGRVIGAQEVEVGGEVHRAERIVIAVGARPSMPEVRGIEHALTSDEALERMAEKPARLAVVGAGYIGLELASIMHGLGIETSLILRRELPLRGFDLDVRGALAEQLRARGLDLRCETTVEGIVKTADGVLLDTSIGPLEYDAVLYATGRDPIPNTAQLGLTELGVDLAPDGAVRVDRGYRSSVASIYAIGDCSDHAAAGLDPGMFDLTPVAIAEGRAFAEAHFNDNPHEVCYQTIPTAVFSLPEAAAVGLTEQRARSEGHDVLVYRTSFRPLLHTLTGAPVRTMIKLVVDRASDRVLGCHMVGDDAAEIMQGLAIALTAGATKAQFDATVGLHPSAAEEFVTMYQATA